MPNPFEGLRPALEHIAREARVLPATGQAMEDLVRPDHEEVVDRLRTDEDLFAVLLETPNRQPYVELTPLHRTDRHLLRYFLDGSARTYYIGDALEGDRFTPIHVAQIGAAAVFRKDDGKVRVARAEHRIVLMLDKQAVSFGESVKELISQADPRFAFHDTKETDGETEVTSPGTDVRSKAPHKAHHLMSRLEEEVQRNLKREQGQWLVVDGSLGKDFYKWKEVPEYVGIAKSFNRKPRFRLPGPRGGRVVNLYELLADLPFAARTCAFSARAGKVVVWYVRIREQKHLDYPLMGVVKVEFPNLSTEAVPSERIDEISAALVAERQVTPHGRDTRWHAHFYAVYLAERAVKNGFISSEALKAGIRWPAIPIAGGRE